MGGGRVNAPSLDGTLLFIGLGNEETCAGKVFLHIMILVVIGRNDVLTATKIFSQRDLE